MSFERAFFNSLDCPASTDQAPRLPEEGPAAPGASGQDGFSLETGALPRSARDTFALASGALPLVLEAQIEVACEQAEALAQNDQLDQGDSSKQPTLGSRAHSR
ncbi:MAG: hypothetical protein ACXVDN_21375 [Ktedonobacteraceae bacterium]